MDTLAYAKELETFGVSTKQAKAHARALANAWNKEAVTKSELQEELRKFGGERDRYLDKRFANFEKRIKPPEIINQLTKRNAWPPCSQSASLCWVF